MKTITIVGLGYVGLPLACLCAERGYKVYGLDVDREKINAVNNGESPIDDESLWHKLKALKGKIIATSKADECVPKSDVVIVCVPTPIDTKHLPDLSALKGASSTVAQSIRRGSLFIIESTIYPGTVEEVVVPLLEKKGHNPQKNDIYVAHCPERIDPGNRKWTIEILPRVVGAITKEATTKAAEFYRSILRADVMELTTIKAAEATKIMENTFRDINIAFINEMAMSFDKAGIDIIEVIKGASTKPFAFMPHYPGAGVGGHCIPVDPYYLIEKAKQIGFEHKFLSLAREINNNMPHYTVQLLESELKALGKTLHGENIGVLGLAYKADVDDVRESPTFEILHLLRAKGANAIVFDPHAKTENIVENIDSLLEQSDSIILVTDHREFKAISADMFKKHNIKIIIDGRNCFDKEAIKRMGIRYHGIGRS